jgi:ATP-dependent Lhr-like helicase
MSFDTFHPLIQRWFQSRFAGPTEPQVLGWPQIAAGEHTLIAAPTGSGKTLTAFLAAIDRLLKLAVAGELDEAIRVVYVSPLRALSNDMHRNLEVPLQEIIALAREEGYDLPPIRVGLRTGDTPASQRAALVRRPPHILVTTPESLYLLLTGSKSRERLRSVETVIVDELHALVRDKRGSHLALSLERLVALCPSPPQRIGLSATQRPIEVTAQFLVGGPPSEVVGEADEANRPPCAIIDVGHNRPLDLAIETPASELGAVCTHEQWAEVNQRLVQLVQEHRSTLIFVNTRRMAERVTHQLGELLGEDAVGSHHGSLAADMRLKTEQRLKSGDLKAVVATASLELGLDIGYIDLVIQLGSPRSIAAFLQRVGRSGHALGLVPKGRLFALTRDELFECMALIRAVRSGRLDAVEIPVAPRDILAQQLVAEVAQQEWDTDELFALVRRAYPYRNLPREEFDKVVQILSEGITSTAGRGRVYLHHDQVQRRLRSRKGASITAATGGGAIPEIASYRVVAEPERTVVGTVDEDFAVESMAGDVFLLGNTSWRVQHVRGGEVVVYDANGAPPSIPFWLGEAPGRTIELSAEVARLREDLEARLPDKPAAEAWLIQQASISEFVAEQAVAYAEAQHAAIGLLPTQRRIVFERFFDESGGMQLVIHAPFGGRITRAWGLALRKRFCRSFDFELQATADDDGIILSLGPQHSFPLESMFAMLNPQNARGLLEQAVLAIPMFQTRWRWNVTRALQVLRQNKGKKVPPPLQRFRSDDLLTAVFPKLTGCQENITGDHEIPDHPLVQQTMEDCLHEALDIDGLNHVLAGIQQGEITLVPRDTREPSPFCYELLNSNPYTFLDGGEVQERRARAVSTRRTLTVESVSDLGRLDPLAIEQVVREAQVFVRHADELHDALLSRIVLPTSEGEPWQEWYQELAAQGRATTVELQTGETFWAAAERLPCVQAAFPEATLHPACQAPAGVRADWSDVEARMALVRGLLEVCGPVLAADVAARLGITVSQADACLEALEGEGLVLRGHFTPGPDTEFSFDAAPAARSVEWCHRRLLARIHRLTLEGLRKQIEPVGVDIFLRYLTRHQGLLPESRRTGTNGLFETIALLQGIDAPAVSWERDLLADRLTGYKPEWLDELCLTGEVGWGRLFPVKRNPDRSRPMASLTRIAPVSLFLRGDVDWLTAQSPPLESEALSSPGQEVFEMLETKGAMFAADLLLETRMLPGQLDEVLGELITQGFVNADGFAGLRRLIADKSSSSRRDGRFSRPRSVRTRTPAAGVGRWSLWRRPSATTPAEITEQWAWQLLRRWGVVFRDLLTRESGAPRWFELLQIYRRLEARGEIRGGRFIAGVAGEQFALGDTVKQLRQLRDEGPRQELVVVSGGDPLNLVGILTDQPRIPSTASNRIAYLDGVPVAALQGGEIQFLAPFGQESQAMLTARLKGQPDPADLEEVFESVPDGRGIPETSAASEPREAKKAKRPEYPNRIPRPTIY